MAINPLQNISSLVQDVTGVTAGGVATVTGAAPITSTGGNNPQIGLTTPLATAFGGTGAASLANIVTADGLTPLTAGWNAGAFQITSLNSEDCLNASEYGVVANGSLTVSATGTDQTANFIAALTAAITAGKKLRLNAGIFKFTQNVVLPDIFGVTTGVHINIEGAGNPAGLGPIGATAPQAGGTILKFWTAAGINAISDLPGNSYPMISLVNLEIQGPDTDVTATSGNGIHITNTYARVNFVNVDVNHFRGGKGYYLGGTGGPENGSFINCTASYDDVGFSFNGASNATQIHNIGVQICVTRGVEILDSSSVNIRGGVIQNNPRNGLFIQGSSDCTIDGVYFESNNSTGPNNFYSVNVYGAAGHVNNNIRLVGLHFSGANDILNIDSSAGGSYYTTVESCHFIAVGPTVGAGALYTLFIVSPGGTVTDTGTQTTQIFSAATAASIFGSDVTVKGNFVATGNGTLTGNVVAKSGGLITLANGANNNLALPAAGTNYVISGPTLTYSISGIAGGADGRIITLVDGTSQIWTVLHNAAGSSAGNKIYTPGGATLTMGAGGYMGLTLQYTTSLGGGVWLIVGRSN
jgi:hypothetical protein